MCKNIVAITDADLIYYYVKHVVDDAFLAIIDNSFHLFVDLRYYEAVKNDSKIKVHLLTSNQVFFDFLKSQNVSKIGLVYDYTSAKLYDSLLSLGFSLYDASEQVFLKTSVKTQSEIEYIKKACKIAELSFCEVLKNLKEGVTEIEVQNELEYLFKKNGAEDKSFNTIIAFGKGSSIPHYKTGSVKLKKNMPVLMDFGCKFSGYCSDMTRSFYYGTPPKKYVDAFNAVKNAHAVAISTIKSGFKGAEADAVARNYLKQFGLGDLFIHSLGHGVGVKIHEEPRLSIKSDKILQDYNVFSIEPGVYFEGEFGIRIEDTVYLKNGKVIPFTLNKIECTLN